MNLLLFILLLIVAVVVLAVVVIRRAAANFKRLQMGCFFDLQARDLPPATINHQPSTEKSE